jgi:hypothetical protein
MGIHNSPKYLDEIIAGEWWISGEQFIKNRPQTKDIRAGGESRGIASCLFW